MRRIGLLVLRYLQFLSIYWDKTDKRTPVEKWRSVFRA